MVDRTMYVTTIRATYAIDAANCNLRWRTVMEFKQRRSGAAARRCVPRRAVFRGTADGRVIALDARTGKVPCGASRGPDPAQRESFGAAPTAGQGKVFIGTAMSERAVQAVSGADGPRRQDRATAVALVTAPGRT